MFYKRNQKIVKEVKTRDNYTCQACNFYYDNKIVKAHHLKPLSMKKEEKLTTKKDLITLCPTCHRLAHMLIENGTDNYEDSSKLITQLKTIHGK